MSNVQNAQLIFGKDAVAAQAKVRELLVAEGIMIDGKYLPYSEIGKPGSYMARYMFYTDETHLVLLSHDDVNIERPEDGGSTEQFCGFQWLIAKHGDELAKIDGFIDDWHHAFGKGGAPHYFKAGLIESGKDEAGAEAIFQAYLDLCVKHQTEWQSLRDEVEVA